MGGILKTALIVVFGLSSVVVGVAYSTSLFQRDAQRYLTAPAQIGNVVTSVSATGRVDAVVTVEVSSQLSGLVSDVFVNFNDEVAKDQPLAQLDQQSFEAAVREAEADLAVAKVNVQIKRAVVDRAANAYDRAKSEINVYSAKTARARADHDNEKRELERKEALRNKGHLSASEVENARTRFEGALAALHEAQAEQAVHSRQIDIAESELQQANAEARSALAAVPQKQAALKLAEVELYRSVIRSPIDGIVIDRQVEPGQTVAASLEAPVLFTIAQDLQEMEIHAKIDEADIGSIRTRQRASFSVDAFPGETFQGTVKQIRKAPQVVQNVVTYTVVIATENRDQLLLPGMTALVQIVTSESGQVLTIPNAALRFTPPGHSAGKGAPLTVGEEPEGHAGTAATVWTLDDSSSPLEVALRVGRSDGSISEVVSGELKADQNVIVGEAPAPEQRSLFGLRLGF